MSRLMNSAGALDSTTFSLLLAHWRQERVLSQSELARRVQVHPSYIHRIEDGERNPPTETIVARLIAALHLEDVAADEFRRLAARDTYRSQP